MTEIILVIIIFILCALLSWEKHENISERNKFINALLARNAQELSQLQAVEKKSIKSEKEIPDFIQESDLSDDQFTNLVEKEII